MTMEKLTDEDLATILLGTALPSMQATIGAARLARVLLAAGIKLAVDVDGEAAAWANLRDMLATATERARRAAHPRPRPAA